MKCCLKNFTKLGRKKSKRKSEVTDLGSTWRLMSFIYSGVTDAAEGL